MANFVAKALRLPVTADGVTASKLIELKDTVAREATVGGTHFRGETSSELTDGASTNPIVIGGESYTAVNGDLVVYSNTEFIFSNVDNKWHKFDDLSGLAALAYVDDAVGAITPAGSLSGFNVTLEDETKYVIADNSADVGDVTAGSADSLTMSVSSETLNIGFSASVPTDVTLPTFTAQTIVTDVDTVTDPSFTGTAQTVTVGPAA